MSPDEELNDRDSEEQMRRLLKKQREDLQQQGWIAHYVMDDDDFPNQTNFHTHGLAERFQHMDIQICLPIHPEVAHQIFAVIVDHIKNGRIFEPFREYEKIFGNGLKALFIESTDGDRPLLRLIIPDEKGRYDAPFYAAQLLVDPKDILRENVKRNPSDRTRMKRS